MPRSWNTHSSRSTPPSPIIWASAWPSPGASGAVIAAQCPSRASPAQARRCGSPPLPPPSPDGTRQLTGRTGPGADSENRLSLLCGTVEMKSWGCPWFPFVLELLREAAAKSPAPLTKEGYRGVPMARQHDTRQPAPGHRDGHDQWRGAWSDKASGTGNRDGLDHSPSLEPHSGGGS